MRAPSFIRAFAAATVALLVLVTGVSAQDLTNLDRVGTELARFNKPGALYAYLRDYHPTLFRVADQAGLAETLDGKVDLVTFHERLAKAAETLPAAEKQTVIDEATHLETILGKNPPSAGPVKGVSAEDVRGKSGADLVSGLRSSLYDSERHWISTTWGPDKRGAVGVRFVPGKVLWFNPNVSIPELGIKAGVPLTEEQKQAVASLFSFQTVPDAPETADGTAAFPAHVGRAINPNSHAITVLDANGEVISDLVVKGGGPNKPKATRDGRLDRSEALMDSEVARNLYRSGIKNYDGLVVIEPEGTPGKAILVRAPRSMLRHLDMDKLSDDELKKTLEHLTNEAAIREGKPSLSISDWLRSELPRLTGENAGRLTGLGVEHGSINTRDNHGMGETVDWGWVALHAANGVDQVKHYWSNVEATIKRVNAILADDEKAVVDDAKKIFDAAFELGKKAVENEKIRLDRAILGELSDSDLRTLAKDAGPNKLGYSATRDEAIRQLDSSGHLTAEAPSIASLAGAPMVVLEQFAHDNGITLPPGSNDRAHMIAAITHQPVATVTEELAKHGAATVDGPTGDREGMSRRLGEIIDGSKDRAKDHVR